MTLNAVRLHTWEPTSAVPQSHAFWCVKCLMTSYFRVNAWEMFLTRARNVIHLFCILFYPCHLEFLGVLAMDCTIAVERTWLIHQSVDASTSPRLLVHFIHHAQRFSCKSHEESARRRRQREGCGRLAGGKLCVALIEPRYAMAFQATLSIFALERNQARWLSHGPEVNDRQQD